jgi:antitoxin component HigA of HigAB toxin-antitoxin module
MNEQQYNAALIAIDKLMDIDIEVSTLRQLDELNRLCRLVFQYEKKHFPIGEEEGE